MFLSKQDKPNDPNYSQLKMLSFAYNPSHLGSSSPTVYGVIVEFINDPFSAEQQFVTCYDSGFSAAYSTQHGGNINGKAFPKYNDETSISSFELFIGSTAEQFPDTLIAQRSKGLVEVASEYLKYTREAIHVKGQEDVQFWFLTSAGICTGKANIFEIKDKSSVWTNLFNEAFAISKQLHTFGSDKGKLPETVSF